MKSNKTNHDESPEYKLLKLSLEAAVPLWIEKFKTTPWDEISKQVPHITECLANADRLYEPKTKKNKGYAANIFNSIAKGIAMLSFAPGGVNLFGLHFEAKYKKGK